MSINAINLNSTVNLASKQSFGRAKQAKDPVRGPLENSETAPEAKKGIFKGFRDSARTFFKVNATVSEYAKGAQKGAVQGAAAGGGVFALGWALTAAAKETKLSTVLAAPFKLVGKSAAKIGSTFAGLFKKDTNFVKGVGSILMLPVDAVKALKNSPSVGKTGKIAAAAVALGVLGYNLVKAGIKANKRKADVDHGLVKTPVKSK